VTGVRREVCGDLTANRVPVAERHEHKFDIIVKIDIFTKLLKSSLCI
jgi:hypothetical protein